LSSLCMEDAIHLQMESAFPHALARICGLGKYNVPNGVRV